MAHYVIDPAPKKRPRSGNGGDGAVGFMDGYISSGDSGEKERIAKQKATAKCAAKAKAKAKVKTEVERKKRDGKGESKGSKVKQKGNQKGKGKGHGPMKAKAKAKSAMKRPSSKKKTKEATVLSRYGLLFWFLQFVGFVSFNVCCALALVLV